MHCYSWCSSLFDSWPHGLTFFFSPSRPVIMWRLLIECQQSNSWSESVSNASDDIVHQQSELMFHNFALGSGETSFDRWSVLMPLIHPVTLKSFHSVTFCYRSVSTGDGGPFWSVRVESFSDSTSGETTKDTSSGNTQDLLLRTPPTTTWYDRRWPSLWIKRFDAHLTSKHYAINSNTVK